MELYFTCSYSLIAWQGQIHWVLYSASKLSAWWSRWRLSTACFPPYGMTYLSSEWSPTAFLQTLTSLQMFLGIWQSYCLSMIGISCQIFLFIPNREWGLFIYFNFWCDHTHNLCELQVTVPVSSFIHKKNIGKNIHTLVMWTSIARHLSNASSDSNIISVWRKSLTMDYRNHAQGSILAFRIWKQKTGRTAVV
jgi:hypothetical protein